MSHIQNKKIYERKNEIKHERKNERKHERKNERNTNNVFQTNIIVYYLLFYILLFIKNVYLTTILKKQN